MNHEAFMVKKIYQIDKGSFAIEWGDGKIMHYSLNDLQKRCPCANCVDEKTGMRLMDPEIKNQDARASSITSVGRYALRIQFLTGCSHGIFGFDMLRGL